MPRKSTDTQARLTSITTPKGRMIHHERRGGESSLYRLALEYAKEGRAEGFAVSTTERQNRKEGGLRLLAGNSDILSISMILTPPIHISRSAILWMIAAAAACRVIERNSSLDPEIGWIGNVYAKDKRVAAFHLNGELQESGFWRYLVLSAAISINPEDYVEKLSDVVTRVFSNRNSDLSDRVAEDFLADFFAMYEFYASDPSFADEYNKRIFYKGRRLRTLHDGKYVSGRVEGLSPAGQLILLQKDGSRLHVPATGEFRRLT